MAPRAGRARLRRDLPAPCGPGPGAVHRRLWGAGPARAGMRSKATSDLWWKNAVVYCLDGMGVSCLWLMPFYPSPRKDDGYDISDFYGVDPRLGTHGDLVEMVRT